MLAKNQINRNKMNNRAKIDTKTLILCHLHKTISIDISNGSSLTIPGDRCFCIGYFRDKQSKSEKQARKLRRVFESKAVKMATGTQMVLEVKKNTLHNSSK